MLTLEECKQAWDEKQHAAYSPYDTSSFERIIKNRVRNHIKTSLHFFWASFVFQVLAYSWFSHVIIAHWQNAEMRYFSMGGVLLYLPFTIVLMQKFKKLTTPEPSVDQAGSSLYDYVFRQRTLLNSFHRFKKWYDIFLVPLIASTVVFITYEWYVEGGVKQHSTGAIITFLIAFAACVIAVHRENKRSFKEPIQQLQNLLNEFEEEKG